MSTDCREKLLILAAKYRNLAEVRPPLHVATQYGYPDVVELLLEYGADPYVKDNKGYTPLHLAAKYGNVEIVKLLLEHGVDPNVGDDDGWTPLHSAAFYCNYVAARILIDHGADPTIRDNEGKTPSDIFRERCSTGNYILLNPNY